MTATQPRVHAGVPTGGQFAASERPEADLALAEPAEQAASTEEWLPPGAHRIVECPRCEGDSTCLYCEGSGQVTTDRYGQLPFKPEIPGTEISYEHVSGPVRIWCGDTVVASEHTETIGSWQPSNYAAIAFGDEKRNVYLRNALPAAVGDAAARHGVTTPEMIQEAAEEMNIGISPTYDEVRAFLARIDDGYLEDIASSAARYRTYHADDLRSEGKTGPALDYGFDHRVLTAGRLDEYIDLIKTSHVHTMMAVTAREHWRGHTVVYDPKSGLTHTYSDNAWERPEEQPLLPWSPPTGSPIAHVAVDGTVTRVDQPSKKG